MMNKVIVLIPHYNNSTGLFKTLEAIGEEEKADVLIVDDGSKNLFDESAIRRAYKANGIITFLYLDQNQGIEHALNLGLRFIKNKNYEYIARLDCDDFCAKDRFKKQTEFLNRNPEVYLVASFVEAISPEGKFLYNMKMPTEHRNIKRKMYFNQMFIHPSVMFRSKAIDIIGFYPTNYEAAEDYAYFFKFVNTFRTAVIPENLVKIQIDDTGISAKKREKQVRSRIKIIRENFYFGFYPVNGLLRSYILLYIPRNILKLIKKIVYR